MHAEANRFSRELSKYFDSFFSEDNLAASYVELLLILKERGETGQSELAESLHLAPSTITRFLARLEKRGWVEKKAEGRAVRAALTTTGKRKVKELEKSYMLAKEGLEQILGNKYVETLKPLLHHGSELMTAAGLNSKEDTR